MPSASCFRSSLSLLLFFFFFFNDTATTEIYTLSLHDALPIFPRELWPPVTAVHIAFQIMVAIGTWLAFLALWADRKSTRLNSSHLGISYAVFCLKKKKKIASHDTSMCTSPDVKRRSEAGIP